ATLKYKQIMKKQCLLILALLLSVGAMVHAVQPDVLTVAAVNDNYPSVVKFNCRPRVAVFDFDSKDEAVRDLGPKVATLINADLSIQPEIITVERAELEKVLGEQELGLSGTVSSDSAAKVGQLTGAKVLVTGRVFKVENQTLMVAKVIGTETGRVYGEMVQGPPTLSIVDLSSNLAAKVAAVVAEKGDTLVAKVQTREERIAKIKQSLEGKKLPV